MVVRTADDRDRSFVKNDFLNWRSRSRRLGKVPLLIFMLGFGTGCAEGYSHNDLRMLTAYRAKEVCSCLFVQQQTEDY